MAVHAAHKHHQKKKKGKENKSHSTLLIIAVLLLMFLMTPMLLLLLAIGALSQSECSGPAVTPTGPGDQRQLKDGAERVPGTAAGQLGRGALRSAAI